MKVLFICTGNTCRSPMAAAYLNAASLPDVTAFSRGLSIAEGHAATNAVTVMREIGVNLSDHKATAVTEEDLRTADWVFCLSASHKAILRPYVAPEKLFVLGGGISDPYGADESVYRNCRDEITGAIDRLIQNGFFRTTTVRTATERDIPRIADLERECFSEPWSENAVSESMKAGTHFLVAEQGDTVLGYLGVSIIAGEGYITNVAVTPAARRKKIASALLERLMLLCREHQAEFISLEVRVSNRAAISLYEKFDFRAEGERKNFYRSPTENALIMTKRF